MFVFHSYSPSMHQSQRIEQYSILHVQSLQLFGQCLWGHVFWCWCFCLFTERIVTYVTECIQTHAQRCFYTSANKKHKAHPPNINMQEPAFPFSLCLWGNLNNNSVCNNASNADPHWSECRVCCGSAASHTHQSYNTDIGIQANCCVCLYMSITYSDVEPDAPMWASYGVQT